MARRKQDQRKLGDSNPETRPVRSAGFAANAGREMSSDNRRLRGQIRTLLTQARQNEQKMQRLANQELRLISTRTLPELIDMLLHDYRRTFELDLVSLALLDPSHELRRIVEEAGLSPAQTPGLVFLDRQDALERLYAPGYGAQLGPYESERHGFLLGSRRMIPASVALLPMLRNDELIGSLNLASCQPQRFIRGTATDFIERLAAVAAICLENATNHERLKRVGLTDPLTRVNNRRFFEQRLIEEVADAMRHRRPLSCMFMDLDRFKRVNDSIGHQAGDAVLRDAAMLMNLHLRSSDVLARYGGEEFVALLPDTSGTYAEEIAQRIRTAVAGHTFSPLTDVLPGMTVSIGIATLSPQGPGRDTESQGQALVAAADAALLRAKENGRNRVVCEEGSVA